MALIRILVDGYSLLHNWLDLAPGKQRHSSAAREELVQVLRRYHDAEGTPITIFFDGADAPPNAPKGESHCGVEVLFSSEGRTADDMIERAAHRFKPFGDVLAVTDDQVERDIVTGLGGHTATCLSFICMVENALAEFEEDLKQYNRAEQNRFRKK